MPRSSAQALYGNPLAGICGSSASDPLRRQPLWFYGRLLLTPETLPLIESQTQSVFARFMAVHTGGALARAVDVIPGLAILDILQVAITLVYRYQPRAGEPIDAGKWCQVMEKERVIATRFFEESQ